MIQFSVPARSLAGVLGFCALAQSQFYSMYGPQSNMVDVGMANMRYLVNQQNLMWQQLRTQEAMRRAGLPGGAAAGQPASQAQTVQRTAARDCTFPYQGRRLGMEELAALIAPEPAARGQAARELGELVRLVAEDMGPQRITLGSGQGFHAVPIHHLHGAASGNGGDGEDSGAAAPAVRLRPAERGGDAPAAGRGEPAARSGRVPESPIRNKPPAPLRCYNHEADPWRSRTAPCAGARAGRLSSATG